MGLEGCGELVEGLEGDELGLGHFDGVVSAEVEGGGPMVEGDGFVVSDVAGEEAVVGEDGVG